MTETISAAELLVESERIKADGPSKPRTARDPVNQPMINNWVEAIGDANPIYVDDAAARAAGHPGIVAPPAMAQVWTMPGLHGSRTTDDPLGRIIRLFDDAGFTSIVATNCDQTYHRYLRLGEQVTLTIELQKVVGPKQTALGMGWFVTTRNVWSVRSDGEGSVGEPVAEMLFRVLKFAPGTAPKRESAADVSQLVRPAISRDTEFFWAGTKVGELRIQRTPDGLRHPPIPAIWQDRSAPVDYQVAAGTGTVFSFVVHHAPKVPGRALPFVVALVELDEGVRMLGELRGIDPADVEIGLPVRVDYLAVDDDVTLPFWRPAIQEQA
ncbi:bifunctional MaoC family dehydratase N-terminal/OB-fold nucleic acid binding domain-containing protein [Skermania piniformis]|uniref:OB-fold domain-containing protein n=1 Tax=Skermania pinensis TaxID=39122 RepID=A0ABX8S9G0_9ACTN|nr:OB-fold domain-containing protein [Skermania piniformis]QXQ13609.1 OB-fold domain-containing protein [Skermania piniformis]